MSLDRRATKQKVRLIIIIPKPPEVLNAPQRRLPIRHRRIKIMLFPLLINAETLKGQIPPRAIMRLHRPRQE